MYDFYRIKVKLPNMSSLREKKTSPAAVTSNDQILPVFWQILKLYKDLGPESMQILTRSFLSSPQDSTSLVNAGAITFKQLDDATDSLLKAFAESQGFDLSRSVNYQNRMEEGYFSNMYPVLMMLLIWLDREGHKDVIEKFQNIYSSAMFGVAGYGILDTNLDEGKGSAAEVLLCLSFIQEHERLLLDAFSFNPGDYELFNRCKQLYLAAEIKEKRLRSLESPYTKMHPEECGVKAVHTFLLFGLPLRKSGKEYQIDDFLKFFFEWGAVLQIMDDLDDLEDDIKNGHYSYPTIGFEGMLSKLPPDEVAAAIKSDKRHLRELYDVCKALINSSRDTAGKLDSADLMVPFVDVLDARLDAFFAGMLKE